MSGLLVAILLAQQLSTAPIDLAAVAAASPRPQVCKASQVAHRTGLTLWERARSPEQQRFCAHLARGYAELAGAPATAIEAARQADRAWPERADPLVLEARAEYRLGRFPEAHAHFERAMRLDVSCLSDPAALHARARTAVAVGALAVASSAYRRLAPRVGLMNIGPGRRTALVEAAVLVMNDGPGALDEALGYLGEGRRQPRVAGAEGFLLGALALALDRQGRHQEARGVAAEAGGGWSLVERYPLPAPERQSAIPEAAVPWLPRAEIYAMVAALTEAEQPRLAAEYWRASLTVMDDDDAWREHAEGKLARLDGGR